MENEVKQRNQRNRRRERAQRMQAQRESKVKDGDSGEDESPAREKPPRPPARRKKSREPLGEEDIIDGFAIMAFRTYEDLEAAVKCASLPRNNLLVKPRQPLAALMGDAPRNHPPNNVNSHGITLLQDAGTSDDSGRASERLTGSSVAPRDPDSSRDRLSDASSRCSSGKGYICDSEGDDDKASPENSRNASPRYHDASMDDASDAGSLFRVTGAPGGGGGGAGGGKNELVARGGSGGALALSRAPVGGSASPAPAPLPQPAPSPAPAALPPPALPPPTFRADTPNRSNGAHIPTLDGHAATQIPARPVGAAGPDTPERPASNNNKVQPGARATADSPTPAPPAPPAPSPLFPSHTAYQSQSQSHAAAALPDYRHTNHETRTEPPAQPSAPLDLHAHQAPRPPHHAPVATQASQTSLPTRLTHSQPHPVMPGHDVRNIPNAAPAHPSVPTSFPSRVSGMPSNTTPHSTPSTNANCLPSQTPAGRPVSPAAPISRSYPAPSHGSSHLNSNLSSNIHSHSIAYQSQSSLQKNTGLPVYANRPSHLAPFSVANHISSSQIPMSSANQTLVSNTGHPVNSHSISSHTNHLPATSSNLLLTSTPPTYMGPASSIASTTTSTVSSYTTSLKHPGLSLPPQHPHSIASPISLHQPMNHVEHSPISTGAPAVVTSATTTISHALPPPVVDSRQAPAPSSDLPSKTESPAINSSLSANGYPPPPVYTGATYPPLYAPYAPTLQHSPYLPPSAASPRNNADTRTNLSASPLVAPKTPKGVRPHTPGSTGTAGPTLSYSPRGHSPTRERESFSNISSLSRSTATSSASSTVAPLAPPLVAPLTAPLAAPLPAPLPGPLVPPLGGGLATPLVGGLGAPLASGLGVGLAPLAAPTPTPAAPTAPHMAHTLAPVPTVPSISSSAKPPAHWGVTRATASERAAGFAAGPPLFGAPLAPSNPTSFSAESLFQTSPGADLLRRELDNRFLAAAGAVGAGVRTEMHHHQHQHTHVHQHPPHAPPHGPHAPPPPHPHQLLVPHSPLFKDKMPSLYRSGLGLGYPYSSSLLHPSAPYVPPTPLTTYAPKPVVSAASDPASKQPTRLAPMKTGKWNAMHVRIAWEIYNHQQKEKSGAAAAAAAGAGGAGEKEKVRSFPAPAPPPPTYRSPYELPPAPYLHHPHLADRRHELGRGPLPIAPLAPSSHFGSHMSAVSPFGRYGPAAYSAAPAFPLSAYGRDLALSSSLHGVHHAPPLGALHDPWRGARPPSATAAAAAEARRDHEERERARREREERERREREERERRKARDQRDRELERARVRSPLRNGVPEPGKEDRKEPPRHVAPPTLGAYPPPPPHWDPYRTFDPLQHMRFAPLVEAAIRAEEDRAKMLSAYAHHQQMKASPLLHRGLPGHAPLAPLGAHASLPPLAPLAPPLAPLAPLDLLKKEEPR